MSTVSPHPFLVIFSLICVQVCFGANYVISKVVVTHFPPLVWASIRISIATLVIWAFNLIFRRQSMPKLDREYLLPMVGFALLGTILNQVTFLMGLSMTTSTNSAILNTMIPVATLAIVTMRGQESLTANRALGFVLALTGVLSIRKIENFQLTDQTFIGDLLNLANCIFYAFFLSFSKKFMEKYDAFWTTAFLFLYGSIGITLISIPSWSGFVMPEMTTELKNASLFAVVFGTLVPYFLNFWALRHARSSQVALFIYVQPIVASFIAWKWYSEVITTRTVLSSLLIFFGMLFALSKAKPKNIPPQVSSE